MKVGLLSNTIILTGKWLRIFGVLGAVIVVVLFNRGPLFDPTIPPITEAQAQFVGVNVLRDRGITREIRAQARFEQGNWTVLASPEPSYPGGLVILTVSRDGEVLYDLTAKR